VQYVQYCEKIFVIRAFLIKPVRVKSKDKSGKDLPTFLIFSTLIRPGKGKIPDFGKDDLTTPPGKIKKCW
jgi:hypothetical protein